MDDLADRLERAAEAMVELGPQLASGEPWPLSDVYGPGPESSWGPREVLAHVAEMLPYWMGEIELILDAGGGSEPPAFGRLEADDLRVAIIGRDRGFPARELLGRHLTRGDLAVRDIAERLMVGHLEGHVTQLREALAAAR